MELIKFTVKCILFFSILLSVIFLVDPFFLKDHNNYYKYNLFYAQENVDVLVIGNSHADSGINHKILKARIGLDSYNLSFERTNIFQTYFNLLEAIRVCKPKLVVIENHTFLSTGIEDRYANNKGKLNYRSPNSFHGKRIGKVKLKEANEMFNDKVLLNTFNLFKFHENWTDLEDMSVYLAKVNSKKHEQTFNGYATKTTILSNKRLEKIKNSIFDKHSIISEDEKECLNKIVELSKQHDFKILFVTIPFLNDYYEKTRAQYKQAYITLDSLVSKHKNVERLDLNTLFNFNNTYFIDEKGKNYRNQHLNYKGSTKATNFIANFIKANFNLTTKTDLKKRTIEDYAYQSINNNDGVFEGSVTKVNETVFKTKNNKPIRVTEDNNLVKIEGWLYTRFKSHRKAQKFLVLKGNNDYIYVSLEKEIEQRKTPLLVERKGNAYNGSGYTFTVAKQMLENGEYEIYQGIFTNKDLCFIENTNKRVIIE